LLLVCFAGAASGAGGVAILHVFVSGSGTVTSNPPGINCPTECAEEFDAGSRVTLTAQPAAGETFLGWAARVPGRRRRARC
jgi:hypothetical protein